MKTASQTRLEIAEMENAFCRMIQGDEFAEAEIIARHYLAHVQVAQQILAIIKIREDFNNRHSDENTKWFLKLLVNTIKRNHAHDFGIELKWEKSPNPSAPIPQSQPQHQ